MQVPLDKLLSLVKLADGSEGSRAFREMLAGASWADLQGISQEALNAKGEQPAFALQDCVNVTGRRLDFEVQFGRYKGTRDEIGFDGLWKSQTGRHFVVEVKKTGAYSIDPEKVVSYVDKLAAEGKVGQSAIGLYVIGVADSKILENTVRGAGYADRLRVLTVAGLIRLADLYERTGLSHDQIVSLLSPFDSVRVDDILKIIEEVLEKKEAEEEDDDVERKPYAPTSSKVIENAYVAVEKAFQKELGKPIQVVSGKLREWDGGRAVFFFSKDYGGGRFWFAIHPSQVQYLRAAPSAFAVFVCGSEADTIVWPFHDLEGRLPSLNVTEDEHRKFWHVHIFTRQEGKRIEWFAKGKEGLRIDLDSYHRQRWPLSAETPA